MSLDVVSLFSGIGGIDLAFERAGTTTRLLCEADKHAASVLAHHWPNTPIYPDVQELTSDDLRAHAPHPGRTILAAGFPCQDLSVAGRRRGMGRGTRSGLYWEIDRLLDQCRPEWVILENVPGLLSQDSGRAMGAVLGSLADRGYGFAFRVLDAQHFGVPQRRRRVVIVGRLGDTGAAPAQVLFDTESGGGCPAAGVTSGSVDPVTPPGSARIAGRDAVTFQKVVRSGARDADGNLPPEVWEQRDVAATLTAFDQGSRAVELVVGTLAGHHPRDDADSAGGGHPIPACVTGEVAHTLTAEGFDASEDGTGRGSPIVPSAAGVRRLTPLEWERLQGLPDGWTERGINGPQSDSQRYKQCGNGVAVPVFEWVARRLVAVDTALRQGIAA